MQIVREISFVIFAFALLVLSISGCAAVRCTATRVEGAPTQTVFYAEVTRSPAWSEYTSDAWPWRFEARELARPHAKISGFADHHLRRGETIVGDRQPGVLKNGGALWIVERTEARR